MTKDLTEEQQITVLDRVSEIKAKLGVAGAKPFVIQLSLVKDDEDPEQMIWDRVVTLFMGDYEVSFTPVDEHVDVSISRRGG